MQNKLAGSLSSSGKLLLVVTLLSCSMAEAKAGGNG